MKCKKCKIEMREGIAIENTMTGEPDFLDGEVVTVSVGGSGRVIACLKCPRCGYSIYPKNIKMIENKTKCADCGTDTNEGEVATFFVCYECWDKHYKPTFASLVKIDTITLSRLKLADEILKKMEFDFGGNVKAFTKESYELYLQYLKLSEEKKLK